MTTKLCVIVGAGASFDCADPSTTDCDRDFRPPLTNQLFAFRPSFNTILRNYRRVEGLSDDIRARIASGTSIEAILKQYSRERDIHLRRQYWEIPFYLQEVLGEVSRQYVRTGATKFDTLIRDISNSRYQQVLFLTLNYDLFLERSFERLYDERFRTLDSYCPPDGKWKLVKLHGSVGWGRELLNCPEGPISWRTAISKLEQDPKLSSEIRLLSGFVRKSMHRGEKVFYPALAIPIGEPKQFVCPKEHVETARDFLVGCSDFLIIGFSALDRDVLELLEIVPSVRKLLIVDEKKSTAQEVLERIVEATPRFHPQNYRNAPNFLFDGGFLKFVGTRAHVTFLAA